MQERYVQVIQLEFNRRYGQWEALGWAERYGVRVCWTAWQAFDRWEVEVPPGQWVGEEESMGDLVREDPPLDWDVRRMLLELSDYWK